MDNQKEIEQKIQELQILEQNLQGFAMQKQAFQLELNQTVNAINEVQKTEDDIYKISSSIMLKTDKDTILKELKEKRKLLDLRIDTIEKQEKLIEKKAEELKKEAKKFLKDKKV